MKTNWTTLSISLVAAVNTALISFGAYHLTNDQLESIDKLISLAVTIAGVVMSHRK